MIVYCARRCVCLCGVTFIPQGGVVSSGPMASLSPMAEGAPFEKLTSVYSDHEGLRENFSGHLKGLKAEKVFFVV